MNERESVRAAIAAAVDVALDREAEEQEKQVVEMLGAALLAAGLDRLTISDQHRWQAGQATEVLIQQDPAAIIVRRRER